MALRSKKLFVKKTDSMTEDFDPEDEPEPEMTDEELKKYLEFLAFIETLDGKTKDKVVGGEEFVKEFVKKAESEAESETEFGGSFASLFGSLINWKRAAKKAKKAEKASTDQNPSEP